jgi:hypothetical protein
MERRTGHNPHDGFKGAFIGPGDQQRLAVPHNLFGDARNLVGGLPLTEDDFRKPLPHGTMVIDASEAEIRNRGSAQIVEETRVGVARIERAPVYLVEEFSQLRRGHKGCFSLTLPTPAVYR